ncbi:hypothetical protein [Bradyrhizobium sp. LA2.1]|uniref:hypothetical protein n=1 Tax=Bradyrhizobium sp. LA2.1 TaxID=3156376 RepID=UPI003397C2CF
MTKGWGRPFEEPIEVDGRKLATPLNAGEYIAALPKKEHDVPEWQAAVEALLLGVERGDPTINPEGKSRIGGAQVEEGSTTVFVYANIAKQVGDKDHIKVFASQDAAEAWFVENDPEGVAFEYEVFE